MSTTQGGGLWVQLEELFVFLPKLGELDGPLCHPSRSSVSAERRRETKYGYRITDA